VVPWSYKRPHRWHCQSHFWGSGGGGGTERVNLGVVVVGLGRWVFRGGEVAMRRVKGDGGTVRGEERWGVGVMVRVERILLNGLEGY
jgi:hypothetical protein